MQSKDRVALAIKGLVTDRVPRGEIVIEDAVVQSILGCTEVSFEQRMEFVRRLGLDIICLAPDIDGNHPGGSLPPPEDVIWPDLNKWAKLTDRYIFIMLDGIFGWGYRLWGFERFLVNLSRENVELMDLIRAVEKFNIKVVERAAASGAMAVLIADDIAYRDGVIAHPNLLRRYIFPSLARQKTGLATMKLPVFFHSDGNLNEVLDDIVEAGIDGLQCIESAAGMDIGLIKQKYGNRLCLWGNLDPDQLLMPRSRRELLEKVDQIIASAAGCGGLIFGTSSGLFKGMRTENIRAVYGLD